MAEVRVPEGAAPSVPSSLLPARGWVGLFLAGEAVALLLVVGQVLPHLLPGGLATQVGHNSEAFALALLATGLLLWLRGLRSADRDARLWLLVLTVSALLVVVGLFLLTLDNPRLKTLNEPVLAAAVLAPYYAWRPRRRTFALAGVAVLVLMLVFHSTELVLLQAESLVALVLAPFGADLLHRSLLDPRAADVPSRVVGWLAFLLLAPVALMVLKQVSLGSTLDDLVFYAARGNEAFWGLFLVHALVLLAWPPRRAATTIG
ncbi:hypothetical protein [Nocardioides sp. SYSU D00038]|uniref:hypothetical protein n=1 Tax=Nocardioides sp. SYSU D00038 TaxID=2812554 RepID=UPI001967FE9C|nr:hypothetical protein [Nocardioides sp. SYSU D00038]